MESVYSLLLADAERANQAIEKAGEILKTVIFTAVSPGIRGADEGLARLAVASSLERIVDYIMNIGELTINLACSSKPEVS